MREGRWTRKRDDAATFPPDVKYQVAFDTTLFVKESIKEVLITLLLSILLVVLVIYLFYFGGSQGLTALARFGEEVIRPMGETQ